MTSEPLDAAGVVAAIERLCDAVGGKAALAGQIGMSLPQLWGIMRCRRPPTPRMILALNLRRVVRYVPASGATEPVLDLPDVVRELRRRCEAAGGQSAWAAEAGVASQYVSDVVRGRREPGPRIIAGLGLRREVRFVPIKPAAARDPR
jgi:DNA-binding transcriptional regulator YdaS (Cro superfamily)